MVAALGILAALTLVPTAALMSLLMNCWVALPGERPEAAPVVIPTAVGVVAALALTPECRPSLLIRRLTLASA